MKLTTLDKFFWEYFKECPRKACLSFYDNNYFGYRPSRYKFKTVEQAKYEIFESTACKFFEELMEKKEITYSRLKEIFYLVSAKRLEKVRSSKKYNDDYKKQFHEMIKELRTFEEFKQFSKILEVGDAFHIHTGLEAKINLTEYANNNLNDNNYKSLKSKFEYKIKFPFYRRTPMGVMPIHFNHSGYPFDIQHLNFELILTKLFFEKCVEDNLFKIIVYDFKSMKRYVVDDLDADFNIIRKILRTIDQNLIYPNNSYDKCKVCPHYTFCSEKPYEEVTKKLIERYC